MEEPSIQDAGPADVVLTEITLPYKSGVEPKTANMVFQQSDKAS